MDYDTMDCAVDDQTFFTAIDMSMEYTMELTDVMTKIIDHQLQVGKDIEIETKVKSAARRNNNKRCIETSLIPAGLQDGIAELYAVDLQMDGCSVIAQERDDLAAILDLHDTDREVDGVKLNAMRTKEEETYMALWKMDQLVDEEKIEDAVEFIDPITIQVLQQHKIKSESSVRLYDKAIPEIFDLLCTDMEVDGHVSQTEAMEAIGPLLQVDQEVSQTVALFEYHSDDDFPFVTAVDRKMQLEVMEAIKPLLEIDEQINNSTRVKKDTRLEQNHARRIAEARLPDGIADLYAIDLQMDGCSAMAEEKNDIAAILDLYDTDREVDGAKRNVMRTKQEEMHMALWKIDQLVDEEKIEDDIEFIDPITVQVLQQHKMKSESMVHRYKKIDPEIFDLLCTDMEVNSCKIQTELMATVEPLLQVDQNIDEKARKKKSRDDFTYVSDLFLIDQEAENAQKVSTKETSRTENEKAIEALLLPIEQVVPEQKIRRDVSRSIFSVQEKDNARKHSVVGGAMEPGILQALLLGGELDADISDKELKLDHSVLVPIRSMQDCQVTQESLEKSSSKEQKDDLMTQEYLMTQESLERSRLKERNEMISKGSTQENDMIKPKPSRRNIFSAIEKFSARQKGKHWL